MELKKVYFNCTLFPYLRPGNRGLRKGLDCCILGWQILNYLNIIF